MYAMVVQGGTEPAQRDEMNTAVKERLIPALLAESGFRGAVNLEDETNGNGMMLTLWDTKEQATRIPDSAAHQDAMAAIHAGLNWPAGAHLGLARKRKARAMSFY